ncbi:DUF881 domain-containing protein [Tomitella fengzijianii]|uniref:DUF881 domain-containing protein n=1 Tax=Tomitella fengzijianii TaxID=2597660 RepID=A0A516X2P6_9ACTN|nr:DUF881 domain-containing protein [Tomitella fengzijianii]QDQ97317.1 DUF881 domain-containing protein [Tomitella fengzijianii]
MTLHRNPEPSLLRSLLHDHLDPGYTESAAAGRNHRRAGAIWLAGGCLVMGLVLGTAAAQQLDDGRDAPSDGQAAIVGQVREQQDSVDRLVRERDAAADSADAERQRVLAGDAAGGHVLDGLARLRTASASTAVHGPGIAVRITEPEGGGDLSDSERPQPRSGQAVFDRDLRAIVNALWAGGAEAVGINGVRIGPDTAIRQAGGAILVDNQPVVSPYEIDAIGDQNALSVDFVDSAAYLRMQSLTQLYGVEVAFESRSDLRLPRAPAAELRYVRGVEEGPR